MATNDTPIRETLAANTPPTPQASEAQAGAGTDEAPEPVVDAVAQSAPAEVEAPRLLAGLQPGRIVNFVLANGAVRPLLVLVALLATGNPVDGIVFFTPHDRHDLPFPLLAGASGFQPEHVVCVRAQYDDTAVVPGTWHWPTKQAVMAAGVDTNAINTIVAAMLEPYAERIQANLVELFDEKLKATVENVNKLLDSHSELVQDAVAQVKHPVLTGDPSPGDAQTGAANVTGAGEAPATGTEATQAAAAGTEGEQAEKAPSGS